jgi:hypothetical protein
MCLKIIQRGLVASQILHARGQEAIDTALTTDLAMLNTVVAGKWLGAVLKDHVSPSSFEDFVVDP